MERPSRNFQLLSDNRKFQAIFASPNRYFTENSRQRVPLKQGPQHLTTATEKTVGFCFQRLFKLFLDNSNSSSLFKGGKISQSWRVRVQKDRVKSGPHKRRSKQFPYWAYVTVFLRTGLFLDTVQDTFSRENVISATSMNAFEVYQISKRGRNVIKGQKLSF